MAEPFAPDGAMFRDSLFLVLCNRTVTTLVSLFALLTFNLDLKPVAPIYSYFAVSFSNVIATTCQYEALKFVSFPVQTLGKTLPSRPRTQGFSGKCAKMIPVMIWGAIMSRKRYTFKDYVIAVLVTGGCTIFLLTGEVKSKKAADDSNTNVKGLLLMLSYLAFDGFTSNFQDSLFKGGLPYDRTFSLHEIRRVQDDDVQSSVLRSADSHLSVPLRTSDLWEALDCSGIRESPSECNVVHYGAIPGRDHW